MVRLIPSGRGHNYTGPLTRSIVFLGVLIVFLVTTVLTITAIITPNWLSYTSQHHGSIIRETLGLNSRCTNTAHPPSSRPSTLLSAIASKLSNSAHHPLDPPLRCTPYPRDSDCHSPNRYFCSMWRTTGFLLSFAVVLEGMTIAAFLVLLIGGKQKREQGWRFMATLAALAATVQAAGMGIISYLNENDEKFAVPGWYLDKSWDMCLTSWVLQLGVAAAITAAALYLPSEGGYELIPDRVDDDDEDFRGRVV